MVDAKLSAIAAQSIVALVKIRTVHVQNPIRNVMALRRNRGQFRINHISWWQEELSSNEEYEHARQTLERLNWQVDYIITHCAPTAIQRKISASFKPDKLTDFLEEIRTRSRFHYWLFGHYHDNRIIDEKYVLLYEQMVRIL